MTFLETPRLPINVTFGVDGGAEYDTTVIELASGAEQRNINRGGVSRWRGTLVYSNLVPAEWQVLQAIFRALKGGAHGIRAKDHLDYSAPAVAQTLSTGVSIQGLLGTGIGAGQPVLQLTKRSTCGTLTDDRPIKKPVVGTVVPYRNAVPLVAGAGAGEYALDTTTGIVTIVADASNAASSITPGATTQVVLAANPGTLIAGEILYLSGFTGADAAFVNALPHVINSVSGAGPYTFTLATNTAGKTITLGSGIGYAYPQAADVMTASFEFDVPVRFVSDHVKATIENKSGGSWIVRWDNAELVELLNP